jgi:hypothetical protein
MIEKFRNFLCDEGNGPLKYVHEVGEEIGMLVL